jgi:hypothetical protein
MSKKQLVKIELVRKAGFTVRMLPVTVSGKTGQYIIEHPERDFFLYSRDGSDKELDIVLNIINSEKAA